MRIMGMNFIYDNLIKKTSTRLPIIRRPGFLIFRDRHPTTRRPFWLLLGIIYFSTGLPAALGAEVSDLIINNEQGHLILSAKIHDVITAEVKVAATEKVSATVIFSIALYQVSRFWFDKKIAHQTATNTIKYDPLKKAYSLMRSWDSGPPLIVGTLYQARHLTTEIKDLKLIPLARLEKGRNYQIRVQAVCQDHNAFIFSPSGCFNNDWYTVEFTF
jgi:hypothetical protein